MGPSIRATPDATRRRVKAARYYGYRGDACHCDGTCPLTRLGSLATRSNEREGHPLLGLVLHRRQNQTCTKGKHAV